MINKCCKCGCGKEIPTRLQYHPDCVHEFRKAKMRAYNKISRNMLRMGNTNRTTEAQRKKTKEKCNIILKSVGITVDEIRKLIDKHSNKPPASFVEI